MSYNAQFVEALKEALNGLRTIHSVGEEWCSYIGQIPTGGVPYCGQEVTRSTYSALWSYAQSQGLVKSESEWQAWASSHGGNVPYYSSGNGSTTFRMPRLVGYVRGASSQSESGSYVAEGLPNITGSMRSDPDYGIVDNADKETCLNGAFVGGERIANAAAGSKDIYGAEVLFDASRSNPIYGNSSHVTPETSVVLFGVYAFGEVGNVDSLDAATLVSALATVEANLEAKLDDSDKTKVVGWNIPDYTAGVSVALPTIGSEFTCPSDGVYVFCFMPSANGASTLVVNGVQTGYCMNNSSTANANKSSSSVPLRKGDVIYFTKSAGSSGVYSSVFYPFD